MLGLKPKQLTFFAGLAVCFQTYSPSSQTSQQESDTEGHLWGSGLSHQNYSLLYKYVSYCQKCNHKCSLRNCTSYKVVVTTLSLYNDLSVTAPQRQTVPVAPCTRLASSEEMTAAIQLVQEHLHSLAPRVQAYTSAELPLSRTPGMYTALYTMLS